MSRFDRAQARHDAAEPPEYRDIDTDEPEENDEEGGCL